MKRLVLFLLMLCLALVPVQAQKHSSSSGNKSVHVQGYYRKDGTYVRPHYRAAPGTGSHSSSSGNSHHSKSGLYDSYSSTFAHSKRSNAARDDFQRQHPCPSNGKTHGACPGYVVDHINPLACGGADAPSNMQWQTTAEGKAKDKVERAGCR